MRMRVIVPLVAAVAFIGVGAAAVGADNDASSTAAAGSRGNPLWAMPLTTLRETRDRPIFSAARRPPTPPIVAAVVEAQPPPTPTPRPQLPALTLLGTIRGGALSFGIFHDPATTKALRLAVGESFGGWVLRAVNRADARFEFEGQIATLELRPATKLVEKVEPNDADTPVMPRRRRQR